MESSSARRGRLSPTSAHKVGATSLPPRYCASLRSATNKRGGSGCAGSPRRCWVSSMTAAPPRRSTVPAPAPSP